MHEDQVRDLLPAWALDAVDASERAAVERAIRADPALAEEARALREIAAELSLAAASTPPAALREATLSAAGRTEQGAAPAAAEPAAPRVGRGALPGADGPASLDEYRERRMRRRDRWVAAAAIVLAAAIPGTLAIQQNERAQDAERRLDAIAGALAEPGAELLSAQVATGGRAVAVVTPDAAVFNAQGLEPPGAGRVYQLWVIADGTPASAGLLPLQDGRTTAEVDDFPTGAALAVTVEPSGGSPAPTTDPVVVLSL